MGYGSSGDANVASGNSMASDATNSAFSAGVFGGTAAFGAASLSSAGGQDSFIVKARSPSAVPSMQRRRCCRLAAATCELAVRGGCGMQRLLLRGWTVQVSATGSTLWAVAFGGPDGDDSASGIINDKAGNVYVCGQMMSTAPAVFRGSVPSIPLSGSPGTQRDIFLAKVRTSNPPKLPHVQLAYHSAGCRLAQRSRQAGAKCG